MDQESRTRRAKRVTLGCFLLDALLAVSKGTVGFFAGSRALMADGANSLSDTLNGLLTLWAWHMAGKPADEDHHYGHGKMETLGAALQGGVMVLFALLLFRGSVLQLWDWWQGQSLSRPEPVAGWVALAVTAVKALQAGVTKRAAVVTNSALLGAKGDDYGGDVGASLGVALSAFLSSYGSWGVLADPLMSLLMALFIFKSGLSTLLEAGHELTEGADPQVLEQVCAVASDVPDAIDCHNVKARRLGGYWAFDLDLTFADDITLSRAHMAAEEAVRRLKAEFGPDTLVRVHQEPWSQREDQDKPIQ